jgi:hypothetical protein
MLADKTPNMTKSTQQRLKDDGKTAAEKAKAAVKKTVDESKNVKK